MYAVKFPGSLHQYGAFDTAARARYWGQLEADGKPFVVVERTTPY